MGFQNIEYLVKNGFRLTERIQLKKLVLVNIIFQMNKNVS